MRALLLERALALAEEHDLSSYHCLFTEPAEHAVLAGEHLLPRLTCRFHWYNRGYRDFQDFLDALTAKRRKQIRRERRQMEEHRIEIEVLHGDQVDDGQWQAFYRFYCSTFQRRWGSPRLTLEFFRSLSRTLPRQTLLILARQGTEYVAGAYAMVGADTVYGRHWGCSEHLPFLHFELCYYQTIDYCIHHGLGGVDAGVQGEHKLNRGFEPVPATSFHWIRHPGFRRAVQDYLHRETPHMQAYLAELASHLPYKIAA